MSMTIKTLNQILGISMTDQVWAPGSAKSYSHTPILVDSDSDLIIGWKVVHTCTVSPDIPWKVIKISSWYSA